MIWMLMIMVKSPVIPDALKPVQTYYKSEQACQDALREEAKQGHVNGECYLVVWK